MSKEKSQPWDRLPGEGKQAYEAFTLYLKQRETRSQNNVSKELGKSRQLISRWSAQYNWVKRAEKFDEYTFQEEMKEDRKYLREMRQKDLKVLRNFKAAYIEELKALRPGDLPPKELAKAYIMISEYERSLVRESIKDNPESTGQTSEMTLAEFMSQTFRNRMEEQDND